MRDFIRVLLRQLAGSLRSWVRPGQRRRARLDGLQTTEEIRAAARGALPKVIFDFVDGGSGDEVTMRRNEAAYDRWSIVPRFLVDVSDVDLSTTVLDRPLPIPLLGSPAGLLGLIHADGEAALATAVSDVGSVYSLAAMSSYSLEEVRAAAPDGRLWFQTYLWRDHDIVAGLLDRAEAAQYEALVVTVDVPRSSDRRRDRINRFGLPPTVTARTLYEGVVHPRWTRDFLLHPRITAANVAGRTANNDAVSVAAYVDRQFDPSATWRDLEWMRSRWKGPLVVKGILDPDDARRAIDLGAQAVAVSNHGGRQLDHAPATLEMLPEVVDAVGEHAEIYVDGGIRRGSDILKAVALGARACMVGRPLVYGLGVAGRDGAHVAMRALINELRAAMMLSGIGSVRDLDPEVLRSVPDSLR